MGATLDQFDTIDLSDNDLRKLDGFSYLPRLKCLLLNNNQYCNAMNFVEALKEFQTLGCADQTKCALACRVYLDLQLDNRVTELEKIYDSSLDLLYLHGKRADTPVNFVPFLSCQELDLQEIERIQSKLTEANESNSITLAICDTTSTILYYQMTNGVLEHKN